MPFRLDHTLCLLMGLLLSTLFGLTACHTKPNKPLCANLTGVWQGHYRDPRGLFNDQPQPIQLFIRYANGHWVGISNATDKISGRAVSGKLWGQCHAGKLTKVFLGNAKQCGHYADNGWVKKNKITLYLPYENAMTGTNFSIQAVKKNKTTKLNLTVKALPSDPKTCH